MSKKGLPLLFFLLVLTVHFLNAQILNPGYTGAKINTDSIFWRPNYLILTGPASSSLNIEMTAPSLAKNKNAYYDPRKVMPKNRLFLDTRSSSYYVPQQVGDKLNRIMNRPSSNEVAPVFTAAMLAASIASQYIKIDYELKLAAADYVLDEKYFPILAELWRQSPQTAFQLFKHDSVKKDRTVVILKKELSELEDLNILKVQLQENAPRLYFPAQKIEEVEQLISGALKKDKLLAKQKQKLQALVSIIDSMQ